MLLYLVEWKILYGYLDEKMIFAINIIVLIEQIGKDEYKNQRNIFYLIFSASAFIAKIIIVVDRVLVEKTMNQCLSEHV